MNKGRIFARAARIVGVLLLGATAMHATLGTSEVLQAIKVGSIMPSMISTFKNVWVFSTVMLFLSAIWLFFIAADLGRLQRKAWWQAVLIGFAYLGGAIGAMVWAGIQGHLVMFAMIGLLLLIPLLVRSGQFSSRPESNSTSIK